MSWAKLRQQVYERDLGRCRVCLQRVGRVWDAGHLIDRCVGGTDTLSNLVLMCQRCNRTRKPVTPTYEAADKWIDQERRKARTGRELTEDWRPVWRVLTGSQQDGTQTLAEHERFD